MTDFPVYSGRMQNFHKVRLALMFFVGAQLFLLSIASFCQFAAPLLYAQLLSEEIKPLKSGAVIYSASFLDEQILRSYPRRHLRFGAASGVTFAVQHEARFAVYSSR